MATTPVAVTVDLVVLTVRDDRLQVLTVRRGEEPFAGELGTAGRLRPPDEDLADAAARELLEETGLASDRFHLEQLATYGAPAPRPAHADRDRRLPRARRRPAHPDGRQRRRRCRAGSRSTSSGRGHDSPSTTRRSSATASSAPAPSWSTRRWPPPSAREEFTVSRAASGLRDRLGRRARPPQLPPQGDPDRGIPGADGRHDDARRRPARAALPGGHHHAPAPATAALRRDLSSSRGVCCRSRGSAGGCSPCARARR